MTNEDTKDRLLDIEIKIEISRARRDYYERSCSALVFTFTNLNLFYDRIEDEATEEAISHLKFRLISMQDKIAAHKMMRDKFNDSFNKYREEYNKEMVNKIRTFRK